MPALRARVEACWASNHPSNQSTATFFCFYLVIWLSIWYLFGYLVIYLVFGYLFGIYLVIYLQNTLLGEENNSTVLKNNLDNC